MDEQDTSDPQTGIDRLFAVLHGIDMRRRTDDKWIAGVCSGLADRLDVDPVIVRAGLVLLTLLGGIGVTVYLLAWALIPNDRDEIVAQRAVRSQDTGSIVLIILATLSLFGGSVFAGPLWGGHSGWGFPWGVALTGLLIWWLIQRAGHLHHEPDPRVRTSQPPTPSAAGASTSASGPVVAQTQILPQVPTWSQTRTVPKTLPVPKQPHRRSGGPLMALLAIGLALVTYGSLIWTGNSMHWTGNHQTIAIAGALAAIGLLLAVLGFVGWRGGFVTFLAVLLAVGAWTSMVVPHGVQVSGGFGDASWTPTSVTSGSNYSLGVGDGVLDLTRLPTEGLNATTIAASVGMGKLTVMVPPDLTVKVNGHVSLGEILLPNDPAGNGTGGSDVSRSVVIGNGPTQAVINAGVGIGQLTVVKE